MCPTDTLELRETTIGDVVEFFDRQRIPLSGKLRKERQGPYPYYGASGVIDYIDDYIFDGKYLLIAEDGENLNSRKLPIAFFAEGKFWVNNHAHIIRAFAGVADDYFIYAWFAQANISGYITGAAQPKLSQANLKRIELRLPLYLLQKKIAAIVSTYDNLIENNLRRIKILEEMAQNLYREWFVKFRFPGHKQVRMVDSSLGKIPEGWEVVPMEDVCARITDGAHRSPKSVETGFPMASVKDMHDWGINVQTCRTISEEEFRNLERNDCKMRKNDLLIAKDGSYLKHCFVVDKDLDVALLSSIAMLRPNERIRPHVLAMTLLEPDVKTRMKGYVSGAALPRIILKEFRKFQIVLAPKKIQEEWTAVAEPMIELCWRLIEKNNNLRQTRDLLLPKLISGKLDVSDMNIETGEAA